jgi:hypothetical protein
MFRPYQTGLYTKNENEGKKYRLVASHILFYNCKSYITDFLIAETILYFKEVSCSKSFKISTILGLFYGLLYSHTKTGSSSSTIAADNNTV